MNTASKNPIWGGRSSGKTRILVTGVGGNVAQGILKALAACGLANWVVGVDCNPLSVGLFLVDKGYVVPKAESIEFLLEIERILKHEKIQLMFVGADVETIHLSKYRKHIEKKTGVQVVVCNEEVTALSNDKWRTAEWALRVGMPHPETVLADDLSGQQVLEQQYGFPLVAKPRIGFASRDVKLLVTNEEINVNSVKWGKTGIVQQYIGTPEREYTASTFSDLDGKVRAVIVLRRELLQGTSYRIVPDENPDLTRQVKRWATLLNTKGPTNFQFRIGENGPVCFEINARFSGTVGVRYLFGYNDVEMAINSFLLEQDIKQPEIKKGTVLRFWEELYVPD